MGFKGFISFLERCYVFGLMVNANGSPNSLAIKVMNIVSISLNGANIKQGCDGA